MPTYEYKCDECGVVFERFQHFSEEPLKTCPECAGSVHRVIQPVGIIFKGKGFYVTDNKGSASSTMPKTEPKGENANGSPREGTGKDAAPKAESKAASTSGD
ncbi:MAG TPA: hypothetical protein GX714_12405 [Chloroflexi bacterium]|nr:hypothetical protein [Chloroflexota bacterium]